MRQPIWSPISYSFDGSSAYVYLWISKKWRIIYVGQTNDKRGTLGRAFAHVSAEGTLRQRFEDETGAKLEEADDLILVSYPLPQKLEYIGVETSYREAIEYLVQKRLRDIRGNLDPRFNIISKVRYTDRGADFSLKIYAEKIVENFQINYSQF